MVGWVIGGVGGTGREVVGDGLVWEVLVESGGGIKEEAGGNGVWGEILCVAVRWGEFLGVAVLWLVLVVAWVSG